MKLRQKYSGKGNNDLTNSQTDQNASNSALQTDQRSNDQTSLISSTNDEIQSPSVTRPSASVQDFIDRHPDLLGNTYPDEYNKDELTGLLSASPVTYESIIDGLTLLRRLLVKPMYTADTHFALLIRGNTIVDLCCINWQDSFINGSKIDAHKLDARYLMKRILAVEATSVLMATGCAYAKPELTELDNGYIHLLLESLAMFDVDFIDWIIMTDEVNSSYQLQRGRDYVEEISRVDFGEYGLEPVEV